MALMIVPVVSWKYKEAYKVGPNNKDIVVSSLFDSQSKKQCTFSDNPTFPY